MSVFYTYLHRRESDNKPFYIGKGQGKRAWAHRNRNQHWKNTVSKHGLKVEIVAEWPEEEMAFEHEKFLIACFRDMGHNLVNITDGGEGACFPKTEDHKKKISESLTGRTKETHPYIAEIAKKLSGRKGEKSYWFGKHISDEAKEKLSIANKGKKLTGEHREKFRLANKGKNFSEEHRKNLSNAMIGNKGSLGKKWFNNGTETRQFFLDKVEEGFVLGRLKKVKNG
jgi:hypothetical protein